MDKLGSLPGAPWGDIVDYWPAILGGYMLRQLKWNQDTGPSYARSPNPDAAPYMFPRRSANPRYPFQLQTDAKVPEYNPTQTKTKEKKAARGGTRMRYGKKSTWYIKKKKQRISKIWRKKRAGGNGKHVHAKRSFTKNKSFYKYGWSIYRST